MELNSKLQVLPWWWQEWIVYNGLNKKPDNQYRKHFLLQSIKKKVSITSHATFTYIEKEEVFNYFREKEKDRICKDNSDIMQTLKKLWPVKSG